MRSTPDACAISHSHGENKQHAYMAMMGLALVAMSDVYVYMACVGQAAADCSV